MPFEKLVNGTFDWQSLVGVLIVVVHASINNIPKNFLKNFLYQSYININITDYLPLLKYYNLPINITLTNNNTTNLKIIQILPTSETISIFFPF